jgi:thermolysin
VLTYDDTWTQTPSQGAVGRGTGVAGDSLKVNEMPNPSGGFSAIDLLRPGSDTTYDLKGNVNRAQAIEFGSPVSASDVATSADGTWADQVASAHPYVGLALDYYRIRFNRAGIDNQNRTIRCFVNIAKPADALTAPANLSSFYNNAFYAGNGLLFFGAGSLTTSGAVNFQPFAAGMDVVSHELSHGVTQYTSNLIYQFESGALNESFSDMMGIAVKFMFQPLGTGLAKADWLQGEDVGPGGHGLRSLSDPHSLGAPDHYSLKLVTSLANDDGGVHTNSNIVNHMYYLAIMGGTNRVSKITVQGVGFDHRDQIEQVIYRAFTTMLPSSATFSVARAATIQAARDLFGAGSAPETAMTQAWNAVGVN